MAWDDHVFLHLHYLFNLVCHILYNCGTHCSLYYVWSVNIWEYLLCTYISVPTIFVIIVCVIGDL